MTTSSSLPRVLLCALAVLYLNSGVQCAMIRNTRPASDPAAAAAATAALVAAGAGASAANAQAANELLQHLRPAPSMAVKSMDSGATPGNTSDLDSALAAAAASPELIDSLAAFLAQNATAEALLAAVAAGDEDLAVLLDSPPYNRTERCNEAIAAANLTAQVVDCYCDGALPWPTCDSLLHLELRSMWSQAAPALSAAVARLAKGMRPRTGPAGRGSSAPATRRRLQQYASCDGVTSLLSFDASSGGCISGYCEAGLYGVGRVYGQVEGCAYSVSIPESEDGYLSDSDYGTVCDDVSGCVEWLLSDLADASLSSYMLGAYISGRVGVCLSVFGLQELLSWFGFDNAFCEEFDGQWWPLKGQVSVGGKVSLGWRIAGLWVRLDGRLQYLDGYSNPMCLLGQLSDWWGCQDFCSWYAGDGRATATAGWDFLWFGDSSTATILDTYAPSC